MAIPEPAMFLNRELGWLSFNQRVLEEARDPSVPLLERVRFMAISASNLDEFFEVRVAGLQAQYYDNVEPQDAASDGMGPYAQMIEIATKAHAFVNDQYSTWFEDLRPALAKKGIQILAPDDLNEEQNAWLDKYYDNWVFSGSDPSGHRSSPPVSAPSQQGFESDSQAGRAESGTGENLVRRVASAERSPTFGEVASGR